MVTFSTLLYIESHTKIADGTLMQTRLRTVTAIHHILLRRVCKPTFYLQIFAARTRERKPLNGMSQTTFRRNLRIRSGNRSCRKFKRVSAGHSPVSARIPESSGTKHDRWPLVFIDQCLGNIKIGIFRKVRHQCHPTVKAGVEYIIAQHPFQWLIATAQ